MGRSITILLHALISSCLLSSSLHGQSSLLPEHSTTNDHFGHSLATGLNWMVIGDPQDSSEGPLRGSVHIYQHNGQSWSFFQRISPEIVEGAGLNVFFGSSVTLDGNWLIVGAPGDDEAGVNTGAAHVYTFDEFDGSWENFDKLFSSNPQPNEYFGNSVTVDASAGLAVVGQLDTTGTGELHPWTIDVDGTTWIQLPSFSNPSGSTQSHFGESIQIEGTTLIAGAPNEDNGKGRAWVMTFDSNQNTFVVDSELQPDSSVLAPHFGSSVDITNLSAIVGSPHDGDGESNGGSAYLFRRKLGTWSLLDKFPASATEEGDACGSAVSIESSSVVVGAPFHNSETGNAYTFSVNGMTAVEILQLIPFDGVPEGYFGYSCLLSNETIAVGALAFDTASVQSGKVYLYSVGGMFGDFDFDNDRDIQDLLILISAWGPCSEPCPPDLDGNSQVDVQDLLAFIAVW